MEFLDGTHQTFSVVIYTTGKNIFTLKIAMLCIKCNARSQVIIIHTHSWMPKAGLQLKIITFSHCSSKFLTSSIPQWRSLEYHISIQVFQALTYRCDLREFFKLISKSKYSLSILTDICTLGSFCIAVLFW